MLYVVPNYYWPIHWWEFPSVWLAKRLNPHYVLYAIEYVLAEQSKMTPEQANPTLPTTAILTTREKE